MYLAIQVCRGQSNVLYGRRLCSGFQRPLHVESYTYAVGTPFAVLYKRRSCMMLRNTSAILGALAVLSLGSVGCATKKHVREAIAPVQNQVNDVQKNTEAN